VITPPDIASQVIVAIPVLILYQVSIFISGRVIRAQEKAKKKESQNTKVRNHVE
jgi:sec-independent protein translocase protein TatC